MPTSVRIWTVTAIAGVIVGWLALSLRAERERTALLNERIAELEALSPTQSKPKFPLDEVQASHDPVPSAPVELPADGESQDGQENDWDARERRMFSNPAYRDAWRTQRQLELSSGNLDLARVMGISRETADQLIAMLVDWEIEYALEAHPNPTNEEEFAARARELQERERLQDVEIEALIGAEKLAQWKEYQESLESRRQVYRLRDALAPSPDALDDTQIEPLIAAIHTEQNQFRTEVLKTSRQGGSPESEALFRRTYVERATASQERIHDAASSMLTDRQLAKLDEMLKRALDLQIAQYQMSLVEAEVMSGKSPGAP